MHRLDRYIDDIEPRLKAVIDNIPIQEEVSLQEALAAYGWVLLDSWVAWRTLRFLLSNCAFYSETSYNECKESQADRVLDKEKANYCDYFKANENLTSSEKA